MRILALATVAAAAAVGSASAEGATAALRAKVLDSIQADAAADAQVNGVQNCLQKCAVTFDNTAYSINSQQGVSTYEYAACAIGCNICQQQLSNSKAQGGDCYTTCKNTDFTQMTDAQGNVIPIVKGIIEPDKACIMGCVINLCQVVCSSGSPNNLTPANSYLWWAGVANPNKGCTIKTGWSRPDGYYAQSSKYNYWNSPQGAGGASGCCSQGMNLCKYPAGSKSTAYKNSLAQAQKQCATVQGLGKKASYSAICAWQSQTSNCGNSVVS